MAPIRPMDHPGPWLAWEGGGGGVGWGGENRPLGPGPSALDPGPWKWTRGPWSSPGVLASARGGALAPYDLVRLNLLNEMREDTYNYDFARYVNFHVHVDAHYHSNI